MKGDFSRLTFDAKKHFSAVRMQQGRVQLDADWNEQLDISQHRLAVQMTDFIGYSGVPMRVDGKDSSFKITPNGNALKIGEGRIYIAGELYENDKKVNFTAQSDYPGARLPIGQDKTGTYLAYLDVWPRHITPLEDVDIREVALGGPDTTTRIKNLWQVKLQKVNDNATFAQFRSDWQPNWVEPISTGQIKARVKGTGVTLENQLYRLEIHQGGSPDQATFKWSRDNGSVAAKVESIVGKTITISSAGRDSEMGFAAGQWVELRSEAQTLFGQPGTLVCLERVQENELIIVNWPTDNPPDAQLVRRWDSQEGNLGRGDLPVNAGQEGWILLEDQIEVQFETDSAKTYKTGDYWLIPARHLTSNIEWLRDNNNQPQYQPAQGIRHHYAALALLNYDGSKWTLKPSSEDLRTKFNPLVGGFVNKAGDTISGDLRLVENLQVDGNVGIGMAASDNDKLKVVGNTDLQGTLTVKGTTTLNDALTVADSKDTRLGGQLIVSGRTTLNDALIVADSKDTRLGGQLTVKGATTLQEALIVADRKNTTLGAQLTVKGTTTLQEALIVADGKNTTLGGQLTVSGISHLAGKVGIGTTELGLSKLKIANSTNDFANVRFDGQGMGQLEIVGWQNGWNINAMTNGKHLHLNRDAGAGSDVLIGRNGHELFIRGSDGHVGIGTTTPGNYKLKVVGNTDLAGTLNVTGATTLNDALRVKGSTTLHRAEIGNKFLFANNYNIRLTGTATESSDGSINPSIQINEINVNFNSRRGLNTLILTSDGTQKNEQTHDLFAAPSLWNDWARWVNNNASNNDLVAVVSHDAIHPVPSGGSAFALLREIGASRMLDYSTGPRAGGFAENRIPYALLFIKGRRASMDNLQNYRGPHANISTTYDDLFAKGGTGLIVKGKVGIGTTTPEAKLHVMGTVIAQAFQGEGSVPRGVITMWSGSVSNIPAHWALCDGNNGTPDLRNRFIVGAGGQYSVQDTGGQDSVTLTIAQMPSHNHDSGDFKYLLKSDGNNTAYRVDTTNDQPDIVQKKEIQRVGDNEPHENKPPYYALAFIMKL